jgi:hypothetical protein
MQIIEESVIGVRSAVITFRRPATPMQFVLFPMVHFGTQGFYKAVTDRLRGCQLVVAEGGRGGSETTTLLGMSCRLLGHSRRLGLVKQDVPVDTLGIPVIRPDMTGREFAGQWRKAVPLLQRFVMVLATPVMLPACCCSAPAVCWAATSPPMICPRMSRNWRRRRGRTSTTSSSTPATRSWSMR